MCLDINYALREASKEDLIDEIEKRYSISDASKIKEFFESLNN